MKWNPAHIILLLLAATIPLSVVGIILLRLVSNQPMSENASVVLMGILTTVGGGTVGILRQMLVQHPTEKVQGDEAV